MERLEQASPFVSVKDPTLKDRIGWLADEAAAAPAALDKTWFRTRVGYVVQDVERLNNTQLVMDPVCELSCKSWRFPLPGCATSSWQRWCAILPTCGPRTAHLRRTSAAWHVLLSPAAWMSPAPRV